MTVVGVVPSPSTIRSETASSLVWSGPKRFRRSDSVSPGLSVVDPSRRYGLGAVACVTALRAFPACAALGSTLMCTDSATPSGSTEGLTDNGKRLLPNSTSTICPYAARVLVLVT